MTVFELSLLILLGITFLIQMLYYWGIFSGLAFYKIKETPAFDYPPVSVVIAARNEYHHLIKNLPVILEQEYPDFEVVVVNHASDDESSGYLQDMSKRHPQLKIVNIERELNFFTGKKFPLSLGIKSAAHEVLLLTDADCLPDSPYWIRSMVESYGEQTEIVLGYGPYKRDKGFVNLLVRYDTFLVAMQYLSYALRGMPYMGVGRNLSYSRSMFFRNKGFTSHYKVASGDDDLFINKVASGKNTKICLNDNSFVYSEAEASFNAWFRQKRRHLTTGKLYRSKFKFLLGLWSLSQGLFFALVIAMLVMNIYPWIVVGLLALRVLTQFIVHKKVLGHFRDSQILLFSLVWEMFHILIIHFIIFIGLFRKSGQWK